MFNIIKIFILVAIDILSKNLAIKYLSNDIKVIGDILKFQLSYNDGIAFSIGINGIILKIITIIAIIGIIIYYIKFEKNKKNSILEYGYIFVIGGAIGNGIERIINSKVTDFISLKYFAIFNFGDIFINIGAILIIYYYYKYDRKL